MQQHKTMAIKKKSTSLVNIPITCYVTEEQVDHAREGGDKHHGKTHPTHIQ